MQLSDRIPSEGGANAELSSGRLTASEVVEELGCGPAQLRVAILTGFVAFLGGTQSLVVTSVTDIIAREWNLSPFHNGMLVTLYFVGVFFGNTAGGAVGDRCGRKQPIVTSFGLCLAGTCLTLVTSGFWSLSFPRFLLGFSFGYGYPAVSSMITETSPAGSRAGFVALGLGLFYIGELCMGAAMTVDDHSIVNLHWKLLTVIGALPAAPFALLTHAFLPESPLYLASRGQYAEAEEVCCLMRRQNGLPDIPVKMAPQSALDKPAEVTLARQLRTLFGRKLRLTTCLTAWLLLCVDGLHYGTMCAFAKAMFRGVGVGGSAAVGLMLGAVSEIAGSTLLLLVIANPRKSMIFISFGLEAAAMATFAVASTREGEGAGMQFFAMLSFHATKLVQPLAGQFVVVYISEVLPTSSRASGMAVCRLVSGVGAALAPHLVEIVVAVADVQAFFWLTAAMHGIGMLFVLLLPYETCGQPLPDDDDCHVAVKYGAAGVAEHSYEVSSRL